MNLILRASMIELVADADPTTRWNTCWIEVTPPGPVLTQPRWKACLPEYAMMCEAISSDIQGAEGSGAATLDAIRKAECEGSALEELGGNAWYTHITPSKVWFEGLYGQGEGGEVSFAQYKLAVQTYVRFLADPEHKPIEVEFPSA
ncbi:hypothetical protein [Piscinibacter sp.]|uniref:hypothetical protein n=1 Tax=Piscinibacter sp. TaxID=1903157 RepID=UPI002BCC9E57|nr:hypothetical protein [Albitalea sp.]HUG21220.1 hypothetical protein [Albitalea sp.]